MGSSRNAALALALAALAGCRNKESASPPATDDASPGPKATVTSEGQAGARDALGDLLPTGAVARLGSQRMLDRSLETIRFLPGGAQLVSASYDRYVVWDATSGTRAFELERRDPGPAIAATPSGKTLATSVVGTSDIQLWDLTARRALPVLHAEREVKSLCYLDEQTLAVGSDGLFLIIKPAEKEPLRMTADIAKLTAMDCGGQVIAIGDDSGVVSIIDLRRGVRAAAKLGTIDKRVTAVTVSPDGSMVAAGGDDGNAAIWPLADPKQKVTIQAHDRQVASVVFASDGKRMWTSGGDAWLRAWSPTDGQLQQELTATEGLSVQYMALSPDGKRAATWSQHRGAKGSEAGRFWLWELSQGDPLSEPERHADPLTSVTFSPDGASIATGSEDHTVRVWDATTGKATSVLTSAQGPVNAVRYSRDGKVIYSAGADGKLVAWKVAEDSAADVLPPIGGKVNAFDIVPDGFQAVTGDETGRVWAWDLKARAKIQALDRQTYSSVTGVSISPDGKLIAITGSERVVLVIGAGSGSEAARLSPDVVSNFAAAFSPDGTMLATAGDDARVRLWSTSNWKELRVLEGHDGSVRCVAFSPDGKRVASGANDTTARVWDAATGATVAELKGHSGAITSVAFSPDGKKLATASHDRTGLVWTLP